MSREFPPVAKVFGRLVQLPSVNLFITNACSKNCSFCCVRDWITSKEDKMRNMSLDDLGKVIEWLKKSKIPSVQILGGEPTLHPNLIEIIKKLLENQIGISGFFTNGLAETEHYIKIAEIMKTNWLINVTHPKTYTDDKWKLLNRNLDLLSWKSDGKPLGKRLFIRDSFRLQLTITFYDPNQDYAYIIDLAKKYNCPIIRYDVSRPSADKGNLHIDFEQLVKLKPNLMRFIKDCVQNEIKPSLDDNLPLCIFTMEDIKLLTMFTGSFKALCLPHLDVMPDLKVEYCTSMRGIIPSHNLQENTATEIFQMHITDSNNYRNYILPQCMDCANFTNVQCQGFCLRYKTRNN